MLVYAFITPRVDYCNSVLCGLHKLGHVHSIWDSFWASAKTIPARASVYS